MKIQVTEIEAVWERTTATVTVDEKELNDKYDGDVEAWLDDNMEDWYGDAYRDYRGPVDGMDRELTWNKVG